MLFLQFIEEGIKDTGSEREETEDEESFSESKETNIKGLKSLHLAEKVYFSQALTECN